MGVAEWKLSNAGPAASQKLDQSARAPTARPDRWPAMGTTMARFDRDRDPLAPISLPRVGLSRQPVRVCREVDN
jgi:hypothetical protein